VLGGLALALAAIAIVAAGVGAVPLSPGQVVAAMAAPLGVELPWGLSPREQLIVWTIRLPRVALAIVVGAGLGGAGAALQGLVRNPLADPRLVGVSDGAALAAVGYLVLGAPLAAALPAVSPWLLPAAAFAGGLVSTRIALGLARVDGETSSLRLILGGVALSALAGAGTGLLLFVADDAQLRSVAFWSLGSLGGATWSLVAAAALPIAVALGLLLRHRDDLDRLLLGEAEARHVGVEVEAVTRRVVLLVALAVGAAVAACGAIGFVGLVVPHLVRGWLGPSHRTLLLASALGAAALLVGADLVARTVAAPAEVPVGVITALIGAPFLLARVRGARAEGR